uniref:G_PROTEIN_RECEP_F1_2 domain-containing protein n=1 Tax=Panagrellus redivivus TaxID=6233 RepID=A0A7E4VZJ3_PANRE
MKVFSSIIFQTILVDIVSSAILTTGQLQMEAAAGYVFMATGNSFINLPGRWRCWHDISYGVTVMVNFWSIPIQAIYRYITVVQKRQVPPYYPAMIYLTVAVYATLFATLYALQMTPIELSQSKEVIQLLPFWATKDVHKFCVIPMISLGVGLYILIFIIGNACGITILLWTTRELNRTLISAKGHLSLKTLQMHREMTKKIFTQTILPCISSVFMGLICAVPFVLDTYYGGFFLSLFALFPWVDVVNPILTLMCIQRYRRVVIAMILRRPISKLSMVAPTSRSNMDGSNIDKSNTS